MGNRAELLPQDFVQRVLRREMLVFFTRLSTAQGKWPAVAMEPMMEALANALVALGKQRGQEATLLHVLVQELQEHLGFTKVTPAQDWRANPAPTASSFFLDSRLSLYFEEVPAVHDIACKVEISSTRCVLKYDEVDDIDPRPKFVEWSGHAVAPGHYELRTANGGHASLHRMSAESRFLEGFWKEEGLRGMWRIDLHH